MTTERFSGVLAAVVTPFTADGSAVAERKAPNRAYIEAAAGRVPVVAGTGALSTAEIIELTRDAKGAGAEDVQALNGWDTLTFAAFALGAQAGVWGAASVIPGLCAELYRAVAVDKDLDRGRELWAKINPICVFLESHNYAGAIKAGTALVGVDAGPTRSPILPLAEEFVDELRGLLRHAGVRVVG